VTIIIGMLLFLVDLLLLGQIGLETFARKLFAEAEEDEKRLGNYFCLYIAIFLQLLTSLIIF
jgi:hypothetical protein